MITCVEAERSKVKKYKGVIGLTILEPYLVNLNVYSLII